MASRRHALHYLRLAEEGAAFCGIAEQRRVCLFASEVRLPVPALSKGECEIADAQDFAASDVENARRRAAEREGLKCVGIGVALPDDIYSGHADVDWLIVPDLEPEIGEHAVAGFEGII